VLIAAGRRNPGVARIAAINPYDYGRRRGIARGSLTARITMVIFDIRVIGETFMRLRSS